VGRPPVAVDPAAVFVAAGCQAKPCCHTHREMAAPPLLAHVGHWYLWVPYLIPVLIVLGASYRAFRQQRREDRARDQAGRP
jgi:hypothetical protein